MFTSVRKSDRKSMINARKSITEAFTPNRSRKSVLPSPNVAAIAKRAETTPRTPLVLSQEPKSKHN